MDKAKLIALIAILYAQEIAVRANMVKDAAKENNLKEGDLFKLLKNAGYDPRAPKDTAAPSLTDDPPPPAPPNNGQGGKNQTAGNIPVLVSHKTEYEKYRCAGLVLTRKPENYLVTEAQFEKLSHDPWVVLKK